MVLTVRKVGNSLGVILPAEVREKLHVGKGDKLYVSETPDGLNLTAYDPDFAETMEVADAGMRQYRNALRELAK